MSKNKNLDVKRKLLVDGVAYSYFSLDEVAKVLNKDISKLPFSLKILLENLIRFEDGDIVKISDIESLIDSLRDQNKRVEIAFLPSRVLMQDFTGVPAVVDLAAMRDQIAKSGSDPQKINPLVPVDLVIDHSIQVDFSATNDSLKKNVDLEIKRNIERYEFLKWGQESFNNFRVVPPGTGICHQVNLENLARVVWSKAENGELIAYPDTVVGTDSHTTMINGLGVLGWGVGGIEAEAAMLGQPISMLIPEVIGFKLKGSLQDGITSTDLVLTITNTLRKKGVVGKFVEFFGDGLKFLSLADRATIANMAPEYGATCGIFPIDNETIKYLRLTGRDESLIKLVESYTKIQKIFREDGAIEPDFSQVLELDLSSVKPCLAGPKRPQDKVLLSEASNSIFSLLKEQSIEKTRKIKVEEIDCEIEDGDLVIAAITSCTNTSNPSVLIAAGLLAKKAFEKGLRVKNFVKTSLAPGSQVVTEYLTNSGLQGYLDKIGFNIVGYGCTTCIGNSGPLHPKLEEAIKNNNLLVGAILSGNRNFEGRVHPLTKANYLASPPLVVAYALAGNMRINLANDPIAVANDGKEIYLKDIWPTNQEIKEMTANFVNQQIFKKKYADLFRGNKAWQQIKVIKSATYNWDDKSTYIRLPNFFDANLEKQIDDINGARILAIFGDSITTDHISPAGNISASSPAADYLRSHNIKKEDFNSYGARRGNHEVMMRGTFANIRIKNEMLDGKEGGYTKVYPSKNEVTIYQAAAEYQKNNIPLVIFAGSEYGTGSSRDWAAKGTLLLGVKAIIAESFERIHRSNLIGMGIMPLTFKNGQNRKTISIEGDETIDIIGIDQNIKPSQDLKCVITRSDGSKEEIWLLCRIDTSNEIEYYKSGGILNYVLGRL